MKKFYCSLLTLLLAKSAYSEVVFDVDNQEACTLDCLDKDYLYFSNILLTQGRCCDADAFDAIDDPCPKRFLTRGPNSINKEKMKNFLCP